MTQSIRKQMSIINWISVNGTNKKTRTIFVGNNKSNDHKNKAFLCTMKKQRLKQNKTNNLIGKQNLLLSHIWMYVIVRWSKDNNNKKNQQNIQMISYSLPIRESTKHFYVIFTRNCSAIGNNWDDGFVIHMIWFDSISMINTNTQNIPQKYIWFSFNHLFF